MANFEKARAVLRRYPDDANITVKELKKECTAIMEEIAELRVPLEELQGDLQRLKDIRYWIRKATPGTEESKEVPPKQSLHERLADHSDQPSQSKPRQQRKQNMER